MEVITARNINEAWDQAKIFLNGCHIVRPSRVGEVWEYSTPVTTEYLRPRERVLFNAERNPNPFFHFFEALWMLAGREDVAWISQFNARMKEYSDDGEKFHGAYGYRWRYAFDMDGGAEDDYADQLPKIARMLGSNPDDRRAVLTMWNPLWDLERPDVKDLPCNTQAYFKIRENKLTMTVCCRSNDIAWGAYGSNVVHFSMLQEYMAAAIGVDVGKYWQISDSWHAYTEKWEQVGGSSKIPSRDYYAMEACKPYPMIVGSVAMFDEDLETFMDDTIPDREKGFSEPFFPFVVMPMFYAWKAYKNSDLPSALQFISCCAAEDWRLAGRVWLENVRETRRKRDEAARAEEAGRGTV